MHISHAFVYLLRAYSVDELLDVDLMCGMCVSLGFWVSPFISVLNRVSCLQELIVYLRNCNHNPKQAKLNY